MSIARCVVALMLMTSAGCKSALEAGVSASLDSFDLVAMTDAMAQSLAGDPEVQTAIARDGRLSVVVEPVVNRLTAEVIPRGQANAFTSRLRVQLDRTAGQSFLWINNRDAFYALRERELDESLLGPSPDAINPRYALTATFSSLTDEDAARRTAYYLCRYELTDLSDRTILWTDAYEVKKVAVKGWFD